MSKNITLFGQDYANVPAINVPLQGGGTAKFIDEDDAGGGSSDFSVKTLTIVNGDTDYIDVPLLPCFGDKTVYAPNDPSSTPIELGDTLYTKDSFDNGGINVGESLTFNVLTYRNKVLLEKLASDFKITPNNGCTVERYFSKANNEGSFLALITFTADTATITLKYQL